MYGIVSPSITFVATKNPFEVSGIMSCAKANELEKIKINMVRFRNMCEEIAIRMPTIKTKFK